MIGYHASHEQFSPQDLLIFAKAAEGAGFSSIMSSDHLAPWSERQGHSGFSWAWLGAAIQSVNLPFGSLAIPTDGRYHPALVAQAAATLALMSQGRFRWIAAGSGEAMNEKPVGRGWPNKQERNDRLFEGVDLIRRLWRGETVSKTDGYIQADRLRVWSLPETPPLIYGAALSEETAYWMGSWADGLITARKPPEAMRKLVRAFQDGGGRSKPLVMQFQLSWAPSRQEALEHAWDQWRCCSLSSEQLANLPHPADFDAATANLSLEEFDDDLCASADETDHIAWISEYQDMGFSEIYLHNRGRNQLEFIRFFGERVLPNLR